MKLNFIKLFCAVLFLAASYNLAAQKPKAGSSTQHNYPAAFTIGKAEFDQLFSKKTNEVLASKSNKYLDKSTVLMNTVNGDTKFMKIKLNYFQNAFLMIQVNGEYSTQVFILSDDKSVFYKGKIEKGAVTMTKCKEDDIVSE